METPTRLGRRAWVGILLRLLGQTAWGAERTTTGVTFLGGEKAPFSAWSGPAQVTSICGFTALAVPLMNGKTAKLVGITKPDAAKFIDAANEGFRAHVLQQFSQVEDELAALAEVIGRLERPKRYPAFCLVAPFLERAARAIKTLPVTVPEGALGEDQLRLVSAVRAFAAAPEEARPSRPV